MEVLNKYIFTYNDFYGGNEDDIIRVEIKEEDKFKDY